MSRRPIEEAVHEFTNAHQRLNSLNGEVDRLTAQLDAVKSSVLGARQERYAAYCEIVTRVGYSKGHDLIERALG